MQVGDRFAMLVVPNHWGDAPIIPGSNFASKLRAWADLGIEMFLHGFFHRDDGAAWARRGPHARRPADRRRGRIPRAHEGPSESENWRWHGVDRGCDRPADHGLRGPRVALRRRRARGAGRLRGCDRRRSLARVVAGDRRSSWLEDRSSPGPAERGCAAPRRSSPRPRCAPRQSMCCGSACIRPISPIRVSSPASERPCEARHQTAGPPAIRICPPPRI